MKPGKMPGSMNMNMNAMMKQAQKLQTEMLKKQEELEKQEYTATAGGGAVTATVSNKLLKSLSISPEAIDPDDPEMLSDLVLAAVNDALSQCEEASARAMQSLTGGIGGLGF